MCIAKQPKPTNPQTIIFRHENVRSKKDVEQITDAEVAELASKLCSTGFKIKVKMGHGEPPKLVIRGTYGLYKHVVRFAPIRTRHGIRNIENI